MADVNSIKDPLVRYVYDFQMKEQAIQHALENSQIKIGDKVMTLEDALLVLAQTYGTGTKEARARTQVVLNTHAMFQHFKEVTFATTEQRNEIIQRAAKQGKMTDEEAKEKAWEQEVLAKARAERDGESLELPPQ